MMKVLMKLLLFSAVLILMNCTNSTSETTLHGAEVKFDTLREKPILDYSFKEEGQYGEYWIKVIQKEGFEYIDTMILTVMKDSVLILSKREIVDEVDRLIVRDLDADGFLEVYIVTIGGSARYENLIMYEIEGDELDQGDIEKLFGSHSFFFTNDQLIHENKLKSPDDCCDLMGLEFVYFELIDNKFTFIKKKDWMHRRGEVEFSSDFSQNN